MPKIGAEPIRKAALINAAIDELGRAGSLDVTVAQIARRAGMSPALAHHYFGSKDQIFFAAMRYILTVYGKTVRGNITGRTGRARLEGIIGASFAPANFRREVVSAWLNFYVLALTNRDTARLLRVYHARLHSNLMVALRPLTASPKSVARALAVMIDGAYLHAALSRGPIDGGAAMAMLHSYLDEVLT